MPRSYPAISSYDPKLLMVWQRAATSPVLLEPASKGEAVRLRQKLYQLRKSLEQYGHELYYKIARATIKLAEPSPGKFTLEVLTVDEGFTSTLEKAGLELPKAPEINFDDLTSEE